MNYYFFPNIKGFEASVTLVNYPPLDNFPLRKEIQFIYVTWAENGYWHYKNIGLIRPFEAKEIKYSQLNFKKKNLFIFFHYLKLPSKSKSLILSDHMYFMPTWRGNIKISSESTSTSYEGDYQYEMIKYISQGSLVSVSPMIQNSKNTRTKFIFVNISQLPKISEHKICFFDPIKNKILKVSKIYSNNCNIINLDDLNVPSNSPVIAISKTISGIPIYFSHSVDKKKLSFEHTHPPSSFTVFGETLFFQKKLKSFWLNKVTF